MMNIPRAAALLVFVWLVQSGDGRAQAPQRCDARLTDFKEMLQSEYADVAPKAGGAKRRWYPVAAAIAESGDLGFTTGPWVRRLGANEEIFGDYLRIWKRDAQCRWHAEFDGEVRHAKPATAEDELPPEQASVFDSGAPVPKFIAQNAVDHAFEEFQNVAEHDGVAAGLRTYARNAGFLFFADGEIPMNTAMAVRHLAHYTVGSWREIRRDRSADSTVAYSVGELTDARSGTTRTYVQLWQYDPRVANWGLRILLINPLDVSR